MKVILIFTIILLLNTSSFANELPKNILLTLPIDANEVSNLHKEWVNKELKPFFLKYGESKTIGGSGITIYYYKTINYQTVMVGTADLKTIMYIKLTK